MNACTSYLYESRGTSYVGKKEKRFFPEKSMLYPAPDIAKKSRPPLLDSGEHGPVLARAMLSLDSFTCGS